MRPYLCGPYSEATKPTFKAAEDALRAAGTSPAWGPHDLTLPGSASPDDWARARIRRMCECDTLILLDGWAGDPTAEFERSVGKRLGMREMALCVALSAGA